MSAKEEIVQKLKALKSELQVHYKVRELGLFGSFVRGEQREASDIDILVEFDDTADLFDVVRLANFLEEQLKRKVDIVSRRALRPELREQVLREVAML
ncbi:nucleotidyltransferase family protein [Candidatus Acetothermia bacterium]|jgi:predicted nucleotidyltransferase|nr:nucleotidyltransferase family protein [Candidatus Acetothermia bacterium]MCI2431440.1 nucleotidyltransferase family protein [Candidatus Acetothermia bacterium]MCI2437140.1 nucleotidyltransferase family protein [Candidatus Acetothermia bacterium]